MTAHPARRGGMATSTVVQAGALARRLPRSVDPSEIRALPTIDALLEMAPFAGQTRLLDLEVMGSGVFSYAVAVPVRDECDLLPPMLAALLAAMNRVPEPGLAIFVVNDSSDGSATLIKEWMHAHALAGVILSVSFALPVRNAPHARRLALDTAATFVPNGVLLTTDADSEVAPHWIADRLAGLADRFDLICEDVRLDATGWSALPEQVRIMGEAEREYYAACDLLWMRWSGGQAGAFAHRASGASMAVRSDIYRALGRWPVPSHGEDGLLCRLVVEGGGRVVTIADGGTRTSARLAGRAAGGCGAALTLRAVDPDPQCDTALVSIAELRRLSAYCLSHGVRDLRGGARPLRFSDLQQELALARSLLTPDKSA